MSSRLEYDIKEKYGYGIEGRTDGLNEIYADKDYRTTEVLAIYQ